MRVYTSFVLITLFSFSKMVLTVRICAEPEGLPDIEQQLQVRRESSAAAAAAAAGFWEQVGQEEQPRRQQQQQRQQQTTQPQHLEGPGQGRRDPQAMGGGHIGV